MLELCIAYLYQPLAFFPCLRHDRLTYPEADGCLLLRSELADERMDSGVRNSTLFRVGHGDVERDDTLVDRDRAAAERSLRNDL